MNNNDLEKYNIFYLFGAGASIDNFKFNKDDNNIKQERIGLPLANNFHKCLYYNVFSPLDAAQQNDSISKLNVIAKTIEYPTNIENLLPYHTLYHLHRSLKEYGTVDETVRAYYLNEHYNDVKDFKTAISLLFFILENVLVLRDYRYKQFLLSIINHDNCIPGNIHFLSWNYDNQFEHSINDLFNKHNSLLNNNNYYKINSSADFYPMNNHPINSISPPSSRGFIQGEETINSNKNKIEQIFKSEKSNILFSWEKNVPINIENTLDGMLDKKVHFENILVCIGYSFPFINEIFDRNIIQKLKPKRIYFQNPNEDPVFLEQIRERFRMYNSSYRNDDFFKHIKDVSRFYIPNELSFNIPRNYYKIL